MGLAYSVFGYDSYRLPEIVTRKEMDKSKTDLCTVRCDQLEEIGISSAEQASTYALFLAGRARAYQEALEEMKQKKVKVYLTCSDARFRSAAVATVWLVWKHGYSIDSAANNYKGNNPLSLYKSAIALAVTILQEDLQLP